MSLGCNRWKKFQALLSWGMDSVGAILCGCPQFLPR
jgi:hypothetical protein